MFMFHTHTNPWKPITRPSSSSPKEVFPWNQNKVSWASLPSPAWHLSWRRPPGQDFRHPLQSSDVSWPLVHVSEIFLSCTTIQLSNWRGAKDSHLPSRSKRRKNCLQGRELLTSRARKAGMTHASNTWLKSCECLPANWKVESEVRGDHGRCQTLG